MGLRNTAIKAQHLVRHSRFYVRMGRPWQYMPLWAEGFTLFPKCTALLRREKAVSPSSSSPLGRGARLCLIKSQTDTAQPGFLVFSHHLGHFHSPSGGICARAQGGSMFPIGCTGTGGMEHPEKLYCFSSRHCSESKTQAWLCTYQTIPVTHLSYFVTY